MVIEMEKDMISGLPDDILVAIISRLTWQEAIATSILSTSWHNLYTYIIRLSYNTRHPSEQSNHTYVQQLQEKEFPKFIREIYDFLRSNKGFVLFKEFRIHLPCLKGANIKTWLPLVLEREVESIDIRMIYHTKSMPGYYSLPYKTLMKKKGSLPGLTSLKTLSLHSLHVEDRDVELFVSNCTVLAHLSIWGSYKLKKVSLVGHSKLKRLEICSSRKVSSIEVREMINLVSLTFHKLHPTYSLLLDDVPNLIEFNSDDQNRLHQYVFPGMSSCILDRLQHVEVHITAKFLLFPAEPLLRNLKHLKVRISNINSGKEFPFFLVAPWECPSLQKLEIKFMRRDFELEFDDSWDCRIRLMSDVFVSERHSHLKELTISGFTGSADERDLIIFLIVAEAKGLKQLVIQTYPEIRHKTAALARIHFLPLMPLSVNLIII